MNRNDQQFIAQKIRTQYMEKTPSELDALRELDSKVKRPANVFAYTFGSVSAVVMYIPQTESIPSEAGSKSPPSALRQE